MADASCSIADKVLGRCKWFDENKGYGFIVVCDGPLAGSDVFVHYKDLAASSAKRRSLAKGEYVSMRVSSGRDSKAQAEGVTGVGGGPLMCESNQRSFDSDKSASSG